jgi:hypothetical protein
MAKYTLELGPRGEQTLAEIAKQQETSKADAIRRAIGVMGALTEEVQKGNKIVIQRPDGTTKEIITA